MKKLLFMLLIGSTVVAKAQTERKVRLNDSSQVVYHVSASGEKDGLYTIKNLSNDGVWVQGAYKNGERKKNWNFFSGNFKLQVRYDYDNKKLTYLDNEMLKDADVKIMSDDEVVRKGASVPVPLCSLDYYTLLVASNLPATNDAANSRAEITAHIDTEGKASYRVVYTTGNTKSNPVFFEVQKDKFAIEWLPASFDNKPIDAELTVYVELKPQQANSGMRRSSWNN